MAVNGLQMMLKSMGIDPEKIMAEFGTGFNAVTKTVNEMAERLERIERKLDALTVESVEIETALVKMEDNKSI